ncbi:hypothetical protein [Streptomyces sp. NBC_01262]|uniref:hypothetical protein n=1 Tax=Streptomyces sp. NBC_01262 TaxID=2903803 RepID=UPI002E367173|nr:hypothetical protein [Streptomyces sp. NBC_01262]
MSRTFLRAMATGAASIMLAGGAMLGAAGVAEAAPAPASTTADHQPGRGHDDHGRDDHGRGHDDHGRGGGRHDDHRHCNWRSGHWTWNWTWRNHHRVQVRQWHPGFRDCRHEPHRRG